MEQYLYFIIVGALFVFVFLFYFIRRQIIIRRNRICHCCGHRMEVFWESRELDPKKESVHIGGMWLLRGKAFEYTSVMHCCNCKYEFSL